MEKKICSNCGVEVEIKELSDELVIEKHTLSPEDDEQLTYEKRQEEAEDRDRSLGIINED